MTHTILIAGGTGLIGKKLTGKLTNEGHKVKILTRNPRNENHVKWSPDDKQIDVDALHDVTVLINLLGENIGEKKWSSQRKKELFDSRVKTTEFLFESLSSLPNLKNYIGSSGINCYEQNDVPHFETDGFGSYFLAELVKAWENAHLKFEKNQKVCILRISTVLTENGGALDKMKLPVKLGVGSALGSGKQQLPWIHIDDLCDLFAFAVKNELSGTYNALASYETNYNFMKTLAKTMNKPFFFPAVPGFVLKIMLGEMSALVLDSMSASNQKVKNAGFSFKFPKLELALKDLLK